MKERQREHDLDKWRWEFMRHNAEVRKDYAEVQGIQKKFEKKMFKKKKSMGLREELIEWYRSKEYKREKELCEKHELNLRAFPDPDKSYEEIINAETSMDAKPAKSLFRRITNPPSVHLKWKLSDPERVNIEIDFSRINSVTSLIDVVGRLIKKHNKRLPSRTRHHLDKRYDEILWIGKPASEKEGTLESRANELLHELWLKDAASATTTLRNAVMEYRRLVDGGYKRITYP